MLHVFVRADLGLADECVVVEPDPVYRTNLTLNLKRFRYKYSVLPLHRRHPVDCWPVQMKHKPSQNVALVWAGEQLLQIHGVFLANLGPSRPPKRLNSKLPLKLTISAARLLRRIETGEPYIKSGS